ncbi:MAG: adenosylhomocysteinase [Dethiobacteria bacterium]|jgi:adenosylhomocysteinase|nr:adenosylhomocysteinase [Bacillota bacterium]
MVREDIKGETLIYEREELQLSLIKDSRLAEEGRQKIEWVKRHMPVLNSLEEELQQKQPFKGETLAICLHLEAKTAYMAEVFQAGGAEVVITGSNPLSTQDDVAAALVEEGIIVFAWHAATEEEYRDHLSHTLEHEPDLVIDDGGDLISLLHQSYPQKTAKVKGGAEETTTGLIRFRAMEREGVLSFPIIAVNDAYCKYLFDNRYGTGQSVWDGIMRTTNLLISGKKVVVAGFGWCGRGVAMRAKGLGARVFVCEVNPIRALEAQTEGYAVLPSEEAAAIGDVFITATGCKEIFTERHFLKMKDGAILANTGHFNVEIDKKALERMSIAQKQVRTNIVEYMLVNGRRLYLLSEGRLVNLASGDGHPAEIMDLSFAVQVKAMQYLKENHKNLAPQVIPFPRELDEEIARRKLKSMGVSIDMLSKEQEKYLRSWRID